MTGRAAETPVFVICRDIVSWTKRTVAGLEAAGLDEIYLIDNDSTFGPLIDWYDETPHTVLRLGKNLGKRGPWQSGVVAEYAAGRRYIVTDPDIVAHEDCPSDWVEHFHRVLDRRGEVEKVGFSLLIDDIPDRYRFKAEVIARQSQFWDEERVIDDPDVLYDCPIDSTLALYRPEVTELRVRPAIRTGHPYVARHLAWYLNSARPSRELRHYRRRVDRRFGNWAKEKLPDRIARNPGRRM